MAYLAARTSAGTRKRVNEDACCLEVAQTPLGEIMMAIVCDGVGGLAKGDLASSTVINRFSTWFESELAVLVEGMVAKGSFDFSLVQAVWGTHLQTMNELIRTHGARAGVKLGTTFTGIIACNGHYLVAHVGDCRAFLMSPGSFTQITEDQTVVAKRLAAGEITEEEARHQHRNVILQSVGTERVVRPVFYEGSFNRDDLFVICCDGAYHRAENEGIRKLFQGLDYRDEDALQEACQTLLQFDMDCGEKDNLTVICFSGDLAGAGEVASIPGKTPVAAPQAAARKVAVQDEDDLATMVESDEDDLATMVESDEDDLATMVDSDEDDLATMVESDEDSDEDDLATMVESDEDDLATMVAEEQSSSSPATAAEITALLRQLAERLSSMDEDGVGTLVFDGDDEDDDLGLPTFDDEDDDADESEDALWSDDIEDEAPTMVADDDDDLPTMVEGADA